MDESMEDLLRRATGTECIKSAVVVMGTEDGAMVMSYDGRHAQEAPTLVEALCAYIAERGR